MRLRILVAIVGVVVCGAKAPAQTSRVLYTWAGTGETYQWFGGDTDNAATVTNSTPGQLTVVEMGDPIEPFDPGLAHVIRDHDNRRFESSTAAGGLDVWGLEALEIDVSHNGSGPINVQFFVQATPDYNYVWAGSNGTLNGPDFSLTPNTTHTLRFPLNLLTPAQQSYIRVAGLSIRAHEAVGNVTWNIHEMRSTGASPTDRILATHDTGTSEGGLQGAFVNFGNTHVQGNNGGQNQTGLSHNPSGTGSLQWTDLAGTGTDGAAISWGNGTIFVHDCCGPNSFNERLSDFSNYNSVTFRMSATDPLSGGGSVGVQAFFQTGNGFTYQTTSVNSLQLPIDGQFHDLVFPLDAVTDRLNTQVFGVHLFGHANNLVMNVDEISFSESSPLFGDYNQDEKVDAADYIAYRKSQGLLGNYATWRQHFGESSLGGGSSSVPEPTTFALFAICVVAAAVGRSLR
jgi:hypothetical protein